MSKSVRPKLSRPPPTGATGVSPVRRWHWAYLSTDRRSLREAKWLQWWRLARSALTNSLPPSSPPAAHGSTSAAVLRSLAEEDSVVPSAPRRRIEPARLRRHSPALAGRRILHPVPPVVHFAHKSSAFQASFRTGRVLAIEADFFEMLEPAHANHRMLRFNRIHYVT